MNCSDISTCLHAVKGFLDGSLKFGLDSMVVVVPIALSWFIRTFVRASARREDLATVAKVANAAIDYVENLDRRGDLDEAVQQLPPGLRAVHDKLSKGRAKRSLAVKWLIEELGKAGITVTDENASKWVAAEFQHRVGDPRPVAQMAQIAALAAAAIQNLDRRGDIDLPPEVDRVAYFTSLGADWTVAEMAKRGVSISRDEALTWVRAQILQRLHGAPSRLPAKEAVERINALGRDALAFVEWLKANGRMTIGAGSTGEDPEFNVAMAWLLAECALEGLPVTLDDVATALSEAAAPPAGDATTDPTNHD